MPDTVTTTSIALGELDARQIGALIEAKLIEWATPYDYDPAVDVSTVRIVPSTQARFGEHRLDPATTEQYAAHMRSGATFPPIVLLGDDILLDGNTRLEAARRAHVKTLPAFKCRFGNPDIAQAFAAAVNQMGGRRLTGDEARSQAEVLMRYGYEDETISRELGYSATQVRNWRRESEAREHAQRARVAEQFEKVSKASARKLASVKRDAPFAALVNLVADTNPKARELGNLVSEVNAAPSDADALEAVARMRDAVLVAGPPPHKPTRSAEMITAARVLPQLEKLAGRELALVEQDLERRDAWRARLVVVRDILDRAIAAHGTPA